MDENDEKFLESAINESKALSAMEIADMTVKLNGIVFRKAELDGNFDKVYSKIFEKMAEFEAFGGGDMTDILGEKGG